VLLGEEVSSYLFTFSRPGFNSIRPAYLAKGCLDKRVKSYKN